MYLIRNIPENASFQLEQLGTKAKEWYLDAEGNKILFKEGRPDTGENWAEKVCCEICRLIGLPHAEYELAVWGDRQGVISPSFVPHDGRLIHGNELLAKTHEDYQAHLTYRSSQHTVSRVAAVLISMKGLRLPIGWNAPVEIEDALGGFVGYLMLDALVSNQDRHHENWGLIESPKHGLCLAPTFDHASSLGRNEIDKIRMERLETKDYGRGVEHYCGRARSGLYKSLHDKKALSTLDAFESAAKKRPIACQYWLMRLKGITSSDFEEIFVKLPEEFVSLPARQFALKMLDVNRERLLNLLETV